MAENVIYLGEKKKCDLVMQGGVTSGIVYPGAACKLAEEYRFVNIGGTSAGAIAAAATAAAEYRRFAGAPEGFVELAKLPTLLGQSTGKGTKLFSLFQPDPSARKIFALAVAALGKKGLALAVSLVWAAIKLWWYWWLLAAAAGGWVYIDAAKGHSIGWSIFFGLLVFILVLEPLLLFSIIYPIWKLPANRFGLCSGMGGTAQRPALTPWLTEYLQTLSGKPANEFFLTFGDLRKHGVTLRMISTCFTHGRPYGLPLDSNQFFFKEEEFREYFPPEVVKWMVDHQGPPPKENPTDAVDTSGFCPWPRAKDLPVVVAARMSLSFPLLFRAVPLYEIDYSLRRAAADEPDPKAQPGGALKPTQPRTPERCWFIDGGITSNFPLDLFDAPIPRWPTFGIVLESERKDRPLSTHGNTVWMPETNNQGWSELFTRIEEKGGVGIVNWLLGIIDAARNWKENRQITVPGYRDRVVHVRLDDKSEGGLQLNMPSEVVKTVSDRGPEAANLLLSHFSHPAPDFPLSWDNHRWVRLRSMLSLLEKMVLDIKAGFDDIDPSAQSYLALLQRDPIDPPEGYKLTPAQREFILEWLAKFGPLVAELDAALPSEKLCVGAPRPLPVLRVLPRTESADDADLEHATPHDPRLDARRATTMPGT